MEQYIEAQYRIDDTLMRDITKCHNRYIESGNLPLDYQASLILPQLVIPPLVDG